MLFRFLLFDFDLFVSSLISVGLIFRFMSLISLGSISLFLDLISTIHSSPIRLDQWLLEVGSGSLLPLIMSGLVPS